MVATAYLPPPPALPVTALPREQVRSLAHIYGHHRRHANYRFCALLPVVVRERIHLDDGCSDPYEWAAKFGGMTRPEVDRILRLWRQIGRFDCLWRLLGEGVGLSKLERVAPHATEENAEWLAEQVRRLSKAELEELLRSMRAPVRGLASARSERRLANPARREPSGPLTVRGVPSGPDSGREPSVPQTGSPVPSGLPPGGAPSVPRMEGANSRTPLSPMGLEVPGDPAVRLPEAAVQEGSPGGDRPGEAFDTGMMNASQGWSNAEPFSGTMCRLSLYIDAVGEKRIRDLQGMYERLHGEPIGLGRLVTLLATWAILRGELPSWQAITPMSSGAVPGAAPSQRSEAPEQADPIAKGGAIVQGAIELGDAVAQADMVAQGAIELGDVIAQVDAEQTAATVQGAIELGDAVAQAGVVAQGAIELGDAIAQAGVEQTAATVQGATDLGDAIAQADMVAQGAIEQGDAIAHVDPIAQGVVIELWDVIAQTDTIAQGEQGMSTEATPGCGRKPRRAARGEPREAARAVKAKPADPADPGLAVPGRKFQPRLLEVVVSIAETGWRFIRTSLGWVPAGDAAVAGFLAPGQPVPLENLRVAAVAAARKVSGKRHRPAAVDRYLFARSGGYCEVRGCNRRAVAAHHRKRFAFDPSHHPDALVCVCDTHHGLAHKGLVQDEDRDPAGWELLRVGEEPALTEPDRKFLAYRGSPGCA